MTEHSVCKNCVVIFPTSTNQVDDFCVLVMVFMKLCGSSTIILELVNS
jgi:hypothetical protein